MVTGWDDDYGTLSSPSRVVFSLNVTSGAWTWLADLPEGVYSGKN